MALGKSICGGLLVGLTLCGCVTTRPPPEVITCAPAELRLSGTPVFADPATAHMQLAGGRTTLRFGGGFPGTWVSFLPEQKFTGFKISSAFPSAYAFTGKWSLMSNGFMRLDCRFESVVMKDAKAIPAEEPFSLVVTKMTYIPEWKNLDLFVENQNGSAQALFDTALAEWRGHVLAKCAATVAETDWVGYDEQVNTVFSATELSALRGRRQKAVSALIESTLRRQDSVWGAKLAGELKMTELLPLLRERFFMPRRCYGWEGPDYSNPESYLLDCQYPYSMAYLTAIENVTARSISQAVIPTPEERALLAGHAANPESEFYHWALWMQRKLQPPPKK